jgi:diguanylate cyclase (GGDEF)-like protein/PAS domain S-box-containing protein
MNWSYALALLLATIASVSIAIVANYRRPAPGAGSLVALGAAMAVWTATYALHFAVAAPAASLFWLKMTYLGVLSVPVAFLAFAIRFSNRGLKLQKRVMSLFLIEPLLTLVVLWWDPLGLFFGGKIPRSVMLSGGPWFWFNVVYSYGLIAIAVILLAGAYRHIGKLYRAQAAAVLFGALLPILANLVGLLHLNPFPDLDPTPFAFTVTSVCLGIGLTRYGLLDLVPVARAAIIDRMKDGILVVDSNSRLLDINQAALKLLDWDGSQVIGLHPGAAFPAYREIFDRFEGVQEDNQQVIVSSDRQEYFEVGISPLYDRRSRPAGRLVVIHDVTAQHMAEAKERDLRLLAEALRDTASALNTSRSFDQILEHLLDNTGRVLPYDMAAFMLLDAHDIAHVACARGFRENDVPEYDKLLHLAVEEIPNYARMIQTGQALAIPDTRADPGWITIRGLENFRSYIGAPVRVKGFVVGFLELISIQPGYFDQAHAEKLLAFADQAALAIENSRLFEETRVRAEQMTALLDIGMTVTSGLDMEQILQNLIQKVMQVLPVEAVYVATYDPQTGIIEHPLFYDMGKYITLPGRNIHTDPGLSGYIIQTRQTLYIPDTLDPEVAQKHQIIRTGGHPTRAFAGVPMRIGDQVVGVLSMQSHQPDAFNRSQLRLLETIATQAAGLIENSRLYREAQQELGRRRQAERRYRALFEQSHDAVFIMDFDGRYLEVNQRAADLLGYTVGELLQRHPFEVSVEPDESEKVLARVVRGEHLPLFERVLRKKNGDTVTVEINVELVRADDGKPLHVQSVVRDITDRKKDELAQRRVNRKLRKQLSEIEALQGQLREQAIRDALTGLYNRRYLEETLEREFRLAERQGTTVCLIMMDIDGFKGFNDSYGHDAGDHLLRNLGKMLQSEVRRSDISCRFGGEEFIIVMPGAPLERGLDRAEQLRRSFEAYDLHHMGVELNATISLGVAMYPQHGETWEQVVHAADRAMYKAKAAGKNCTRSA